MDLTLPHGSSSRPLARQRLDPSCAAASREREMCGWVESASVCSAAGRETWPAARPVVCGVAERVGLGLWRVPMSLSSASADAERVL